MPNDQELKHELLVYYIKYAKLLILSQIFEQEVLGVTFSKQGYLLVILADQTTVVFDLTQDLGKQEVHRRKKSLLTGEHFDQFRREMQRTSPDYFPPRKKPWYTKIPYSKIKELKRAG